MSRSISLRYMRGVSKTRLLTWNVCGRSAGLELALQYLTKTGERFIAAFPEAPATANDIWLVQKALTAKRIAVLPKNRRSTTSQPPVARVAIYTDAVTARDASVQLYPELRSALAVLTVESSTLWVWATHALDRRNNEDSARRQFLRECRILLHTCYTPNGDSPVVLLGDFNEEPYERGVLTLDGLWALFSPDELDRRETEGGKVFRPFFNPMWRVMADGQGTYWFGGAQSGEPKWRCLDQIIVSQDLMRQVGDPTILTSISGQKLVNGRQRPNRTRWSDHLPVEVILTQTGGSRDPSTQIR